MADGITTVVSRSAIPEKIQEVTERAAENRQQATTVVAQQQANERIRTVQKADKVDLTPLIRRKESNEKKENDEKRKRDSTKNNPTGRNLDMKA
jgi:hypothetical protein